MDPLMSLWVFFIGTIIGILIGVGLSHRSAVAPLQKKLDKNSFQLNEHQEIMRYYPFAHENFRFIGSPIDGIQFEEDQIMFVLFKKENVPLTFEQNRIKTLLETGKIKWIDFIMK
jgi:hypothetical protein